MENHGKDKSITHLFRALLILWNIGLFAFIWFYFYNRFVFNSHYITGGVVTICLFFILYSWNCSVFKAFRFASTPLYDLVFAHLISFGLPDLLFWVQACLIHRIPVDIGPGAIIVVFQLIGSVFLCWIAKRWLIAVMKPDDTLIIYGALVKKEELQRFIHKLLTKYDHLYDIQDTRSETEGKEVLEKCIDQHSTVILLAVTPNERREYIKYCMEQEKTFLYDPRVEDIICQGCNERHLLDTPLMKYDYVYNQKRKLVFKRFWDIFLSLIILIVFSPLLLVTAAAIKIEDGGPVFYRQKRYTKGGKVFEILKFRSMIVNAEASGVTPSTKGDPRVTKVGRVIRACRIDELPQLINVLKGDMSFVGPRPERVEHTELYAKELPEFKYRLKVKAGLTGYAQVYGKYNTTPYDKLRLDLIYIENQSFLLDLKIVLLTVRTVFQKESSEGFSDEQSQTINLETQEPDLSHIKDKT